MKSLTSAVFRQEHIYKTLGLKNESVLSDLPTIVPIGGVKSGKSSIIESLLGYDDFLPKSFEKETLDHSFSRRPIKITFSPVQENSNVFPHVDIFDPLMKKEKYKASTTDFFEVRSILESCITETTGSGEVFLDQFISVTIHDYGVCPLVFFDLPPSIVHLSSSSLTKKTNQMMSKIFEIFASRKDVILLHIISALDLIDEKVGGKISKIETSNIINLFDPNKEKTIEVITRMDEIQEKEQFPMLIKLLKREEGDKSDDSSLIAAVINRSKENIKRKISMKAHSLEEKTFFSRLEGTHSFKNLGKSNFERILSKLIYSRLPPFYYLVLPRLDYLKNTCIKRLESFGDDVEISDRGSVLIQIINGVTDRMKKVIDGNDFGDGDKPTKELYGGSRVNYLFFQRFVPAIEKIKPDESLTDNEITMRIMSARGTKCTLYVPHSAFEGLVLSKLKLLDPPCWNCVDLVIAELYSLFEISLKKEKVDRFPHIKEKLKEFFRNFMEEGTKELREYIRNTMQLEKSHINMSHPDLIRGLDKVLEEAREKRKFEGRGSYFGKDDEDVLVFRTLLKRYFDIIKVKFCDFVPKAIVHFIVNKVYYNMLSELMIKFYTKDNIASVQENEMIVKKRTATKRMWRVILESEKDIELLKGFMPLKLFDKKTLSFKEEEIWKKS